ncbi:MAG TPA: hypothetical protein VER79_13945 [Candidatus Limnocylindrales bacterium]|nr:hypothetical protein [Candidatus Limnocylindrales bacterium]
MPVDVRWLVPGRVIMHEFSGRVELEDTTRASLEGPVLADQGTTPVHMIVSLLAVTHFPRNLYQLQTAIRDNPRLDRLGWIVITIRHNPMLSFVASILTQVRFSNLRISMSEDMAGALRQLRERDTSLESSISPDGELIDTIS